jgi:hypothetical protein
MIMRWPPRIAGQLRSHRDQPGPRSQTGTVVQAEALDRLRSVNAQSVRAYQVIELPRSAHDAPEGSLRLALGRHSHESWWERVASYLDKAIDEAEMRGEIGSDTWKSLLTRW